MRSTRVVFSPAPLTVALLFLIGLFSTAATFAKASEGPPPTRWRWLGVSSTPTCPTPTGPWLVQASFPGAAPASALASYCTFSFTQNRSVTASDVAHLQALVPGSLSELATDGMAVGGQGTPPPASLWVPLAKYFLDQAGRTLLPFESGVPPVRLALLDTHPTDDIDPLGLPANSPHGHTLLTMADRLLCSDQQAGCVVHLASRLALSYVSYDADDPTNSVQDPVLGGYVGTIGELAQAIFAELQTWRSLYTHQRLILNLSVGWNPEFGGRETDPAEMPVAVRMVYDAISEAACEGALVMAATGNRTGGPRSAVGPMMPAAWAARPAPTSAKCDESAVVKRPDEKSTHISPKPLLYAAGGVQGSGEPLSNSLAGSLPERVAIGDHGVVRSESGDPTAILTGSSVSALVTSASAAAAWYYAPTLDADEVMETVDGAGDVLPIQADFCFGPNTSSSCAPIRRVSVCQSAAAACSSTAQSCLISGCEPWDPTPADLSENLAGLVPSYVVDLEAINEVDADAEVCHPSVPHFDPALGPANDPCPDRQYTSVEATPWVHPQPGSHACPPCRVNQQTEQLIIEIDEDFAGTLSEPTLDVCGNSYSLGQIPLVPGESTIVENVDTTGCSNATVSFTVEDNGTISSSIDSVMIVQ